MGECLITRRGGESYELPVLDENYPQDVTLTVIKGNTVEASFNAVFATHGKPAEYTYQWYVDGAAVEGANSALFIMADLGETVNHSVYCEITNKAGTVTTRVATLKVTQYYTPVLNASYPADVTLNDGSTTSATFKVQIDTAGNPAEHTYQWYVNGEAVEGETGASYTRSNLIKHETLSVYCEVTNKAGTIQSRTATLAVKHTLLYNVGEQYTEQTGGFGAYTYGPSGGGYSANTPTIDVYASSMKVSLPTLSSSKHERGAAVYVENLIDLTNCSTLKMNVTNYSDSNGSWDSTVKLIVTPNKASGYTVTASKQITAKGTISIDVSGLSGEYYIVIGFHSVHWMAAVSCTFDKLWLV